MSSLARSHKISLLGPHELSEKVVVEMEKNTEVVKQNPKSTKEIPEWMKRRGRALTCQLKIKKGCKDASML